MGRCAPPEIDRMEARESTHSYTIGANEPSCCGDVVLHNGSATLLSALFNLNMADTCL